MYLFCTTGKYEATNMLPLKCPETRPGADETINYFCALVEGLPKEAREIWNGCCSRVIDVGYESGNSPRNFQSEIRASTVQQVAAIDASIVVTIYPLSNKG